jgi:gliding motility-associated-like protein
MIGSFLSLFGNAQVVSLGSSASYALYSTGGAVSNGWTVFKTRITGDVGSASDPTLPGFGNIDGKLTTVSNLTTNTLINLDVLAVYANLNTAVPTFFPAPLLGNGQVLLPGVYSIAAPSVLNLNLILDAQNDPNAQFIIKIGGAFSTNANAKVKLINGAQACNVFWKVEGAVSLATGTFMKGTIIANNAAITMSPNDTLEGRAFAIQGAITVSELFAYLPTGCGSTSLQGPVAPNLGSAGCFALFSANGVNTNVGITNVVGDVGTNGASDLTTGYNSLLVVGNIHPIPDLVTAQAAADLLLAYNYLVSLNPGDIELIRPDLFGHNLVLTPHTYIMQAAVTFTDTLYLDAKGNTNAVFIINVNGAFATNVNAKVVLLNGAQAKNCYWKIDGAVTIGANALFNGTLIANGAINVNSGAQLNGRALTVSGALLVQASNVQMPTTCSPQITLQPVDNTSCLGDSVSFTVVATGSGLTYQWRRGSVNLVNNSFVSGVNAPTLIINPSQLADFGTNYNVIVTGVFAPNDTSINVSLIQVANPQITTQPTSQTVCEGTSVSFSVVATGTNVTYQWYQGLIPIANSASISGETSATLTINPTALSDAGTNYNVVVVGTCPTAVISNDVTLAFDSLPIITTQPASQTVCEGTSVSFSVVATGTNLTYQWRRGLVAITNSATISGVTSATLTINPTALSDAGTNYNVVVAGSCPTTAISNDVVLNLDSIPLITTQPASQTVCEGTSVSFTVVASGTNLTYQWYQGLIPIANSATISGTTSATLTINPSAFSDAGTNYNVVVSGSCPTAVISSDVALAIDSVPIITTQPSSQIVCEGSGVSFTVVATGTNLTYQWYRGSIPIANSASISGATSVTMTINPIALSDAGSNYSVIVSGTCQLADSSNNFSLTIETNPLAVVSSASSFCIGADIQLFANTVIDASYQWSGPNNYSSTAQNPIIPTAVLLFSGEYTLSVSVGECYSIPTSVNITVINCDTVDFFIPEGFSPNSDEINDLFVIRGIENYPSNDFVVFNRWGDPVFDAQPYTNNWAGTTTKGISIGTNVLPVGTYFYVLHLGDGSPVLKGTIYLNR